VPANDILQAAFAAEAPRTIDGTQFHQTWFFAIFLFCGVVVLSNVVHYVVFRILRRREKESKDDRWNPTNLKPALGLTIGSPPGCFP
jgi:hypothetical protein